MTFWFFRQWTAWSCNSRTIHLITYPSPHQPFTTKSTPPLPHQPFKPSSTHSHPLPTTQPFTTKSTPPFPHRSFKPSSTYSPFLARGIKGGNLSLLFLSFPSSRAEHNNTQAVCLCPATELLSSAEGLCVSNKFLLPVYLHDNLCVFTVTIQAITVLTGARLSFCLFIRRFIKIICYVRQANQKGDIFPDVERLLSSCKIYDDDTKVDLVFVVFFLYFSLFVSGCVCVTFVFAVVYNAL